MIQLFLKWQSKIGITLTFKAIDFSCHHALGEVDEAFNTKKVQCPANEGIGLVKLPPSMLQKDLIVLHIYDNQGPWPAGLHKSSPNDNADDLPPPPPFPWKQGKKQKSQSNHLVGKEEREAMCMEMEYGNLGKSC
ncbi:Uncharacterized protein TCM_045452 [Theobroma cacao]|uniref:Uncharacterized protein n=1 Tax=Theobroma cacao TaxID=3641 RepID=A0A061FRV3_THECC|nr:Uncharacterized protein TCM_045452 [Theobroma cacao]